MIVGASVKSRSSVSGRAMSDGSVGKIAGPEAQKGVATPMFVVFANCNLK